jgi:hypothetical protein
MPESYTIYQDGNTFANETDERLAAGIFQHVKRTYPKSEVKLVKWLSGHGMIVTSNRPRGYSHPHAPNADRVHRFTQQLHGSGIDYDWEIQETKSSIRASNSYHAMDEYGRYDRIIPFTVIFPKDEQMSNFKLTFGDSYGAKKYGLSEYLGDEIAYTLDSAGL